MKKVLVILNTPRFSGAEKVVVNLFLKNEVVNSYFLVGNKFTKEFDNLKLIRTSLIRSLNRNDRNRILPAIIYLPSMLFLNFLVFRILLQKKFDVVHINNRPLNIYLAPTVFIVKYILRLQVRFIFHDHNLFLEESRIINKLEQLAANVYDPILVVSKKNEQKYAGLKSVKGLQILYNGIDTEQYKYDEKFRAEIRKKFNLKNKLVFGIFGNIHELKGQLEIIEVIEKLSKEFPNLHLLIIGRINSTNEAFSEKLNGLKNRLPNLITILDYCENIVQYYSAIDIYINNTSNKLSESLSTSILEAMACERILITSSSGGTDEIISDNQDGIMFNADAQFDLEEKIRYVITNFEQLSDLRKKSREKVIEKFNIYKMVENYNKIIIPE